MTGDLFCAGREKRRVNGKDQLCILFKHHDLDSNSYLYAVQRYVKVQEEGQAQDIFNKIQKNNNKGVPQQQNSDKSTEVLEVVDESIFNQEREKIYSGSELWGSVSMRG